MSVLRQLLRRGLEAALPSRRFLVRGPSHSGAVALTFDDGPHPDITPRLLDALGEQGIAATFFIVGREAERHPALVRRIVAEGHCIGHHSWSHSEPSTTNIATLMTEVSRCRSLLHELTGISSDRFRPPKGQLTLGKLAALLRAGQRIILWSEDPKDYAVTEVTTLQRWARTAPMKAGSIVLMHDTHPWCLDTLAPLRSRGRELGVRFVTLDAWLPASG